MKKSESGASTLLVLAVMTTLAVFTAVAVDMTMGMGRNVRRTNTLQAATAIGNGAIENAFVYWREICRINSLASMPSSYFYYIPMPQSSQFPHVANFSASYSANSGNTNYTVSNCKVVALDPQLNQMASDSTPPPAATGRGPTTTSYYYLASADVTLPDLSSNITMKVRRIFQKELISPWNWAIFYVDPLEIHPGPPFTVTGWVHTNSNLYTGHNTLTFANKVTYGNDWYIGFMPGDGAHNETPQSPNWPSNLPPALDVAHQPFGLDASRIFNTANTNDNDDSYHELVERPDPNYADPLDGQRYYDQAGVKILVNASNTVTIMNSQGNVITGSSSGLDKQLYQTFTAAITTNGSIQDNREQATVRIVNVDMSKITADINAGKLNGFNSVVYIADTSASTTGGSPKRGIRLKNGSVMPTGGLTVASDNPVYVQGDFNTGANPPSNSGTYSQPTAASYTKQPCAIIGDAVNILSNAWQDSNSTQGIGSRIASNTTVNAAIVAGMVQSANGNYSGGAENFPRFLEDWGGKSLTYYGSMIELYQSKQAIGNWGKGNVYSPPARQWFFDTNFQVNPPPGSLMVYNYIKQRWFQQ